MEPSQSDCPNPQQDIAALRAYKPRQAAIEMLLAGRFDDYLEWARGDGYWAAWGKSPSIPEFIGLASPMPLDMALDDRIMEATPPPSPPVKGLIRIGGSSLAVDPFADIPHFCQSPIEILLRSGSTEVIDSLLSWLASPARRFGMGFSEQFGDIAWYFSNWSARTRVDSMQARSVPLLAHCRSHTSVVRLILLPLLLGRTGSALAMLRHGLGPADSYDYADLGRVLAETHECLKKDPAAGELIRRVLDVPADHLEATAEWLFERAKLAEKLEDLFGEEDYPAIRERAFALLDKGAPVGYYPLMIATEQGDLEMLRRLFAAGANPNCRYKTGVPALARLDMGKLSEAALQIWLDAGASPIMGMGMDRPFGEGMCPSPLLEAIWEQRTGLVKQMVTRARGPVPLSYKDDEGQLWAPMLALALNRGADELAAWMVAERGESLDGLDEDHGDPARSYASAAQLDMIAQRVAAA